MKSSECGVRLHQLRQLDAGERDADLQAHAATCAHCSGRLQGMAIDREAFLREANPAIASAKILEKLATRDRRWVRILAPLLACFALAVFFIPPSPDQNRTKGGAGLTVFVRGDGGPTAVAPGMPLRAGDQIQLRYAAGGHRYAYIASIDGRGAITPLHAGTVEPSGEHILDGSTILDDALGPERIFAFYADEPLTAAEVEDRLRAVADVRATERVEWPGIDQASAWFLKVP